MGDDHRISETGKWEGPRVEGSDGLLSMPIPTSTSVSDLRSRFAHLYGLPRERIHFLLPDGETVLHDWEEDGNARTWHWEDVALASKIPAVIELPKAVEAVPKTPLDVGDAEAQKSAEVAPVSSKDTSVVDAQKAAETTPPPTVLGDVELNKADEATHDVSTNTGMGEPQKGIDATPAGAEHIDSIYRKPDMPLALLRTYSSQARWVGFCRGSVIFEEDAVQYPASTPTPMCTAPGSDQHFDLVSLWLLVALRCRYEEAATPSLLEKLEATRIPEAHVAEVLGYLSGQRDRCTLLPTEFDSKIAQTSPLVWLRTKEIIAASSTA